MYFTVNTAFMHYFDSLTNNLENHILQNWTMHEQFLPISLQTSHFDSKLLDSPKTKGICPSIPTKKNKY